MARVLVVEDSKTQALEIQLLLQEAPFDVELAHNGVEAIAAMRRAAPDIVLTDMEMPKMNGLALVEAIRRDFPHVPVVLMTAHGSEEIAAVALSKGAASYIPKGCIEAYVVPTLERVLALTCRSRQQIQAFASLTASEFHFTLDNDAAQIAPVIGYLDDVLRLVKLGDPTQRMRIGVALQEALLNAMYHGNLEVGSELRQQDENAFHRMIDLRRTEPPYNARRVFVDARISPEQATYTVRDEGHGYNPAALPDPLDPENIERIGGRGLLLIRTFMNEVTHNAAGNAITMVKRRDG